MNPLEKVELRSADAEASTAHLPPANFEEALLNYFNTMLVPWAGVLEQESNRRPRGDGASQ